MSGEKKYYLANLPANTDLRTLAAAIKARCLRTPASSLPPRLTTRGPQILIEGRLVGVHASHLRFRFINPRPPSRSTGKKLAAFSALGGGFLRFPIGDRRCNRTRASVGNAGGNARPSLTNATLAASRLLHRRSPTAPCSKGLAAASRLIVAARSAPHRPASRLQQ